MPAELPDDPHRTAPFWQAGRFRLALGRPLLMGIVNVTPDSFSDGGRTTASAAIAHAEQLLKDGADILDIGGESTRPGSEPVPAELELARVLPVLRAAVALEVPVSIDTLKPAVMQAALDLGADIVNDVQALRQPGALEVVAAHPSCGVCLMHMLGDSPKTMQAAPVYTDVIAEVRGFLRERVAALAARGVAAERLSVDPGIGFGKTVAHNLELLARQHELLDLGLPILAGWSRKSTLGSLCDRTVDQRLAASLAAALAAVQRGARILRVHDVRETADALKVWAAAGLPG